MGIEIKRELDSLEKTRGRQRGLTKLSVTELQSSKKTLIKMWQMKSYPFEYPAL